MPHKQEPALQSPGSAVAACRSFNLIGASMRLALLLLTTLLLQALHPAHAAGRSPDWTWRVGRATHYGGPGDGWSIHEGSCMYYYLDKGVATGWDIVAPADANWDFDGASGCGACYEVACNKASLKDGYGNYLDRSNVCYDPDASVIVMVTDTCPCNYPGNWYSNKRWCCGDMFHLDMSSYAFEKLADKKWGVMSIKYRRVSCDHQPAKRAYLPSSAQPSAPERSPPWGWSADKDRRPRIGGGGGGGGRAMQATAQAGMQAIMSAAAGVANGAAAVGAVVSAMDQWIIKNGRQSAWADTSLSARLWDASASRSSSGGSAYCSSVAPGGALSFTGWNGALQDKRLLVMLVKKNDLGMPDFGLQLAGKQGSCREVRIPAITWTSPAQDSAWVQLTVPLNAFAWSSPDWSQNAQPFRGCGGSGLGAWDVTTISLKNARPHDQWLCLDQLRLAQ